ncbi:MAG TPA: FkbM family methyltransferase [Solirubrobacteraceae bacterium]|jgi:FkbM family methyltransferase|nr:FkbM family methyltransferase [Solirubrobacteraceae bacterium]
MPASQTIIRRLGHVRRRAFELAGSERYSRTGALDIDRKLERWVGFHGGFFVEAGANDGINLSNTYFLERLRGWTGLLVEGIPDLARACAGHRPRSRVVQCALVGPELDGGTVRMHYSNLQSIVDGALPYEHVEAGAASQGEAPYAVDVPARTLSSVLDDDPPARFDLLVLDVEGYEPHVLRGLDLDRHGPDFALIEVLDPGAGRAAIDAVLGDRYAEVDRLGPHDVLFQRAA